MPNVRIPDVFFHEEGRELGAEAEISADGLPDVYAVKGARHRVDDLVRYGSVELVSSVKRGDESRRAVEYGLDDELDPFGGYAPEVGVEDGYRLYLEHYGELEHRPERGPLTGMAPVDRDPSEDVLGDFCLVGVFPRVVERPAVAYEYGRGMIREVFRKPLGHLLHDKPYGVFAVVTRDSDQYVHALYLVNPPKNVLPDCGFVFSHNLISPS